MSTAELDPISRACRLLREGAAELKNCHTLAATGHDWTGEPEAKTVYDESMATADALESWAASIGCGGVEPLRGRQCLHQIAEPAGEYPALPEPDAVAGPSILQVTEQMRAAGDHAWMTSDGVDSARVFWAMLAAAPTTQPAPQQEAQAQAQAQEPVAVPRFNCWSTNEGDSWFDHPADSQAIYDCLGNNAKVGDEYELTAGWESVTARYRITGVVGDGEEYEVECISHPRENTAPQPSPVAQGDAMDSGRLDWLALAGPVHICLVIDRGHDGDVEVSVDGATGYGKTLRAAIDAARAAQEGNQ